MAKKKTQLKVTNSDKKSQKEILSAVAKIEGVEKLEIDANKGVLTVIGEVEPMPIFKALKKIGAKPEIISVGPPKPAGHPPNCSCSSCQPHSDKQKTLHPAPCRHCYNNFCSKQCDLVALEYSLSSDYSSGQMQCSIL